MEGALVLVVVLTASATAVLALILWTMHLRDRDLEQDIRESLQHELRGWCSRSGWTPDGDSAAARAGPFDPRKSPGHDVIAAAHGEVAGCPAVLLLCKSEQEDGAPAYATAVLRLGESSPTLEIRKRYVLATLWKAQRPAPPDPSAADKTFHRLLKIGPRTGPDAGKLLTDPVRAALLDLNEMGLLKDPFVDLQDGYLRVLVSRWPPALVLDRYIGTVTELAEALLKR